MKKKLWLLALAVCLGLLCVSAVQLWRVGAAYRQGQDYYKALRSEAAVPAAGAEKASGAAGTGGTGSTDLLIDIPALQAAHPDIAGWLSLPGTAVDYPFVQSRDNNDYLRHDLEGQYLEAGTIFIDCRNSADFSDFVTILYGHNMRDGSMFAELAKFRDADFFAAHRTALFALPSGALSAEIVAFLVVEPTDELYSPGTPDAAGRNAYWQYLCQNAVLLQEGAALAENDRLVLFSTCDNGAENARLVLAARLPGAG